MTGNMPEVGPVGRNLIGNVERLRAERGLSLNRLSALLEGAAGAVPPLGLSRMRNAERRTDVDELVALAEVLDVTPDVLLAPPGEAAGVPSRSMPPRPPPASSPPASGTCSRQRVTRRSGSSPAAVSTVR